MNTLTLTKDREASQYGFSMVEVLAVLIIASTLLASMMSILLMSQRSFQEFSNADQRASERFFFEQQFAVFAEALETLPHPEIEGTCEFKGDDKGFSGCFYDIFDGVGKMRSFAVTLDKSEDGTVVLLDYKDEKTAWFTSDADLSIKYQNIAGQTLGLWPAEEQRASTPNLLNRPIPPSALVLEFAAEGAAPATRRLFVTKRR